MLLPTEPIGSIPRPESLLNAFDKLNNGTISKEEFESHFAQITIETIRLFEETGSPVISDGEQKKYDSFWTYPIHGLKNLAPDGFSIPFAVGHIRQFPRLVSGPFRYNTYANSFLDFSLSHAKVPVKQAVISASALSLMYPITGIDSYPQDQFLEDLVLENEKDIRLCLEKGAHCVQIDFTEGRLATKIDPTGDLLENFIVINNLVLDKFTKEERKKIGIHTCPGGDRDSTHSADADYAKLLPSLFELLADNFYIQLSSEKDRPYVLRIIKENRKPHQRIFVGVIDPINSHLETPEEVCQQVLEAAKYIPLDRLGTTDDCGFSPFCDDASTTRELAFAKIKSRVLGTEMASKILGVS